MNLTITKTNLVRLALIRFDQIRIKISSHSMYVLVKKIHTLEKQIELLKQDYQDQSDRYYELEQKVSNEVSQSAIDDFHTDESMPF